MDRFGKPLLKTSILHSQTGEFDDKLCPCLFGNVLQAGNAGVDAHQPGKNNL